LAKRDLKQIESNQWKDLLVVSTAEAPVEEQALYFELQLVSARQSKDLQGLNKILDADLLLSHEVHAAHAKILLTSLAITGKWEQFVSQAKKVETGVSKVSRFELTDVPSFVSLVQKVGVQNISKSIAWTTKKVVSSRIHLLKYVTDNPALHSQTIKAYEEKSNQGQGWTPLTSSEGSMTSIGSVVYASELSSTVTSFIGVETQNGELHLSGASTFGLFRQVEVFSNLKLSTKDTLAGEFAIYLTPADNGDNLVSLTLLFNVEITLAN
jgi:hypothetical protein